MGSHLDIDDVAAGNPLAERELAELRRDAERYRWLRNKSWSGYQAHGNYPKVAERVVFSDHNMRCAILAGEAMDAEIDAAMNGANG